MCLQTQYKRTIIICLCVYEFMCCCSAELLNYIATSAHFVMQNNYQVSNDLHTAKTKGVEDKRAKQKENNIQLRVQVYQPLVDV